MTRQRKFNPRTNNSNNNKGIDQRILCRVCAILSHYLKFNGVRYNNILCSEKMHINSDKVFIIFVYIAIL